MIVIPVPPAASTDATITSLATTPDGRLTVRLGVLLPVELELFVALEPACQGLRSMTGAHGVQMGNEGGEGQALEAERVERIYELRWFRSHSYKAWIGRHQAVYESFGCKPRSCMVGSPNA